MPRCPTNSTEELKVQRRIIRPHHSTTCVDVAYCYSPSNVVCRSVTVVSPTKMLELIVMPFGLRTGVGPRNHVLDIGLHPPMGRGNSEESMGRPLLNKGTLWGELCKNSWIDQDAASDLNSGEPKEPYIRRGPDPSVGRGNFKGGKRRPLVQYSDSLPWVVQKRLNWSKSGFGLGWAQGSIRWRCTLAPPDDYH